MPYGSLTAIGTAKISEFPRVERIALPQLRTTLVGERVEIPNVSPGQTRGRPKWREICFGRDSQPFVIENVRRYSA